jgi:hypothetical protein
MASTTVAHAGSTLESCRVVRANGTRPPGVVPFEEEDESPFVGLLQVEGA